PTPCLCTHTMYAWTATRMSMCRSGRRGRCTRINSSGCHNPRQRKANSKFANSKFANRHKAKSKQQIHKPAQGKNANSKKHAPILFRTIRSLETIAAVGYGGVCDYRRVSRSRAVWHYQSNTTSNLEHSG